MLLGLSLLKKKNTSCYVFENPHQDVVSSAVFSFRGWVGKRPFTRSKLLRFVHMTLRSLDQVKGLKQNSRKHGLVTINNIFLHSKKCILIFNIDMIYLTVVITIMHLLLFKWDFLLWMSILQDSMFLFSRSSKQCNKYYHDVCINSFKLYKYLLMVLNLNGFTI